MAHVYARPHHMLQTEEEVLGIVEDDPSTSTREIPRQVVRRAEPAATAPIASKTETAKKTFFANVYIIWINEREAISPLHAKPSCDVTTTHSPMGRALPETEFITAVQQGQCAPGAGTVPFGGETTGVLAPAPVVVTAPVAPVTMNQLGTVYATKRRRRNGKRWTADGVAHKPQQYFLP
ncbi:hypothetical protein NQ317_000022 [Molorchus minor]|uniref:Uncharacterized protein n=1 Tax=Molorchus minor TaxID=1323400 RepID=A0ABQ9JUE0_9CUCU|nr:hypothetical protein NQ317_000022 [Molorchus minor]